MGNLSSCYCLARETLRAVVRRYCSEALHPQDFRLPCWLSSSHCSVCSYVFCSLYYIVPPPVSLSQLCTSGIHINRIRWSCVPRQVGDGLGRYCVSYTNSEHLERLHGRHYVPRKKLYHTSVEKGKQENLELKSTWKRNTQSFPCS